MHLLAEIATSPNVLIICDTIKTLASMGIICFVAYLFFK